MPLGPDERIVFEEHATPLYEEIVTSGGIEASDARIAARGELHAAFELLVDVGLVIRQRRRPPWTAVDPAAVQARVVAPLGQQGAELIAESANWAHAFSTLSQVWRRSRAPSAAPSPRSAASPPSATSSPPWSPTPRRSCSPPSRSTGRGRQAARRRRRRARHRRPQARREDAHALPARRATRGGHPQVRRRGDRRRRGGAHPRRVLQPPHRGRPAGRAHPRPRAAPTRRW